MTSDDFVAVAAQLAVTSQWGPSEARYRSAISRAYYGAFHTVCESLRSNGRAVRRSAYGHQDALDALRKMSNQLARDIAWLLDDLRSERIRADYRLESAHAPSQQDAVDAVEAANKLLSLLKLLPEPTSDFRILE